MKHSKLFLRFVSLSLVASLMMSNQPWTQAAAEEIQEQRLASQYVSDVKMFYGFSEQQAKTLCEEEGYYFCPENLKEGSGAALGAYLGYKVTEDPDEAVTDLSLLDMKASAYEEMSYEEYLDKYVGEFADQANQIMVLVNEYRKQKAAGSPYALIAYDSLNSFYVDESRSHTDADNLLGQYLLNNGDAGFFAKFIQRGSAIVYAGITGYLAVAAADWNENRTTWVDRAKKSAVYEMYKKADSAAKNQYNSWYGDSAKELIRQIRSFAETYTAAKPLYDRYGKTFGYDIDDDSTMDDLMEKYPDCRIPEYLRSMELYELMDSIVYQEAGEEIVNDSVAFYEDENGEIDEETEEELTVTVSERQTLAEYFLSLADDPELSLFPERVYPLLDGMTAAQRVVLETCGLDRLVRTLFAQEDYAENRKEILDDNAKQLKEAGFSDGKIYLWAGVDTSIYTKKVAETKDLIQAKNGGKQIMEDENAPLRKESSKLTMAIKIADIVTLTVMGVAMIVQAFVGSLWGAGVSLIATGLFGSLTMFGGISTLGAAASMMLGTALCAFYILNVLALVISLALCIYLIMDACGVFDELPRTDYSTAPDILYHTRTNMNGNYRIQYDAVAGNLPECLKQITDLLLTMPKKHYEAYDEAGYIDETDWMAETLKESELFNELSSQALSKTVTAYHILNKKVNAKKKADLGAYLGIHDRWLMMYTSKAKNAGKPIEVVPGQSFFMTGKEYLAKDGYRSISLISGTQAANINDIDMELSSDQKEPLYMFIPGISDAMTSATVVSSDQYVTKVLLAHADKRETAINILQKDGLEPIQTNLTPYDGYTFLGYQLGNEAGALTDLRVSTLGTESILYGSAQYGKAAVGESGTTPDGVSIYATASLDAGSPITKISVETERLPLGCGAEPVCLFSGGQAVDFKHKWSDNAGYDPYATFDSQFAVYDVYMPYHDKTAQDDPVDGLYIYFWPKEQYIADSTDSAPPYVAGFSYFMAANKGGDDQRFGTNQEFMKTFAKENGFELLEGCNTISSSAAKMKVATIYEDKEGGVLKDWTYDIYHTLYHGMTINWSDGGGARRHDAVWLHLFMDDEPGTFNAEMYFGVSYTYNPHRAITGISGLITPYTETTNTIRYTGLSTPAGTMLTTNVSIQGNPITAAGVSVSYYNMTNMAVPFYLPWDTRQNKNLDWMTEGETEELTHYLLTAGPVRDVLPIRRDEIRLVYGQEKPTQIDGFVPVCDLRTPGDYDHPMNLALDTANKGSEYLYLYVRKDAGGRIQRNEKNEIIGRDPSCSNQYTKKHYIAAVFCGTGKTPEAAISNLYAQATKQWATVSELFSDIPEHPLAMEFDEIIPLDISSQDPWYAMGARDVSKANPSDNQWVYGNDLAYKRWKHSTHSLSKNQGFDPSDKTEGDFNCTYIGVVRTNENTSSVSSPVYGILKYYNDAESAPSTLKVGETQCTFAGGPVRSKEGQYYLYYSRNSGTAAYSAPITEIDISKELFINGYNTSFSCSEKDRVNFKLPAYHQLRMRTDEYYYIHTKYDLEELPYIESIYMGIGKTREEALADMIGTTNANAATTVNCNYNSCSDQWIAIGYRRTSDKSNCIHDLFLYVGDNPPEQFDHPGGYVKKSNKYSVYTYKEARLNENGEIVRDEDGMAIYDTHQGVPYNLLRHNLKSGAETVSLNEGSGGPGIYLYYTISKDFYYAKSAKAIAKPIRNIAFAYGDISPLYANEEDLAAVYQDTLHGQSEFQTAFYRDVYWENVLAVDTDAPSDYLTDGSNGFPLSLNYGVLPGYGNNFTQAKGDTRVRMYIDRGASSGRANAQLTDEGYYSASTVFGRLRIK